MLVLTRRTGEWLRLRCADGTTIWVGVADTSGKGKVRLALAPPPGVEVLREELLPPDERRPRQ